MKKKIIFIFVMTLLIATASSTVGMMNVFPSNNSTVEKTGTEDYMITNWYEHKKLVASAGAAGGSFGYSVSIDGDYAIIGAPWDDDNGYGSGSAYVFKRDGTSWTQDDRLLASDGAAFDRFGWSVSIDGDYAIIGAPSNMDNVIRSGSAYLFKRDGTSWTQYKKLSASDGAAGDWFGWSVSIDGDYAIIGAHRDDDNGYDSGSAYIFKRVGSNWNEQAKLLASDGAGMDEFGGAVSIDGDYAIIGADGGLAAYVFKRDGAAWNEEAKLRPSDGTGRDFGISVSIDGDYAIIGAEWYDNGRGAAYIFKRTGTSWAEEDKLTTSDDNVYEFGRSVSIDGDYAIIGVPYDCEFGYEQGSAYVFKRDGTNWNKQDRLLASDGAEVDHFGRSVSIDGDYAIIGAAGADRSYVFKRDGTSWTEQDKLQPTSCGVYSNTLLLRLLERFPFLERFLTLLMK